MEDQTRTSAELSGRLESLDQKVDRRLDTIDRRMDALDQKLDRRMDALDQKVDGVRVELSGRIDLKADRASVEDLSTQLRALDAKMTNQFKWLVGINVTMWALTVTITVTVILVGMEKVLLR